VDIQFGIPRNLIISFKKSKSSFGFINKCGKFKIRQQKNAEKIERKRRQVLNLPLIFL
jgi:hypothetical protein